MQETTMALAIQATINAENAKAQQMESEDNSDQDESIRQTEVAQAVQSTLDASHPTATAVEPATAMEMAPTATQLPPTNTPAVTSPPEPPSASQDTDANFEEWMKEANILLYEDMAGVYTTTRFVKASLDRIGLDYVDVGDAVGHYKDQLLSGGPGGKGWDLIISSKEARGLVQGEFYVYLNDALNDGSSVIVEEWAMDSTVRGSLGNFMGRCSVEFRMIGLVSR